MRVSFYLSQCLSTFVFAKGEQEYKANFKFFHILYNRNGKERMFRNISLSSWKVTQGCMQLTHVTTSYVYVKN